MRYCIKCGQPINEGQKFCIKCGTPVEQVEEPTNNNDILEEESSKPFDFDSFFADDDEEEEVVPEEETKSHKKLFIIIGVVVALLLASAGAYFIFFSDKRVVLDAFYHFNVTYKNDGSNIKIADVNFKPRLESSDEKAEAFVNQLSADNLKFSRSENLSTGQTITVTLDVSEDTLKENHIKLKEEKYEFEVNYEITSNDDYDSDEQLEEDDFSEDEYEEDTGDSEYILPDSNSTYLTLDDLEDSIKTARDCRIAVNEIYARHGYHFGNKSLREYFNSQSWYHDNPNLTDQNKVKLSSVEKENVKLLKKYRETKRWHWEQTDSLYDM